MEECLTFLLQLCQVVAFFICHHLEQFVCFIGLHFVILGRITFIDDICNHFVFKQPVLVHQVNVLADREVQLIVRTCATVAMDGDFAVGTIKSTLTFVAFLFQV